MTTTYKGHVVFIVSSLFFIAAVISCTHYPSKPGQEVVPENETQLIEDIKGLLITQLTKQYTPEHTLRDTHPKSNGCLRGQFQIDPSIPDTYQQGIFRKGSAYPVWMRFSNSAPMVTPDKDKDFRGLGIKLFNVDGERLPFPGDEQRTQDFLFIGFPAFFAGNPQDFHDFFEALFSGGERRVKTKYFTRRPRALYNTLKGRQQFANPLEITWFSVAPFSLGQEAPDGGGLAVKYKVRSCPNQPSQEIPTDPSDDYLEEAMKKSLSQGDWCLEFMIQEQTDPASMPIEDTLTAWDEEIAPFTKVATITLPQQDFTSDEQKLFCENLSFNPWHGLKAHKPVGGINRARRDVMKALSDFRLQQRGVPRTEPTGAERF